MVVQITLVIAFLALLVTYRNYPAIIARGLARERAVVAGERAYAQSDYTAAERWFRAALLVQPDFVDAQVDLALALDAQGRHDEAAATIERGGSRRADMVRSVLAQRAGDSGAARAQLTRTEASAGEEIQLWALEWLRPPATDTLSLGDGRDMGYIAGFTRPEGESGGRFRWLTEAGRVVLPLPRRVGRVPTGAGRFAGGRPGHTPLELRIGDGPTWRVPVAGGPWRVYRLPVPPTLAGQTRLTIELRASPFIPAFVDPSSDDLRVLSVRISSVRVVE